MTVSVLVVDDSGFFRKRLTEILTASGQIKVIGAATNGREGVELAEKLRPDVITMDYEMPVMDGISAVREIMRKHPTPVLMFSSLTYEGARVTLDALEPFRTESPALIKASSNENEQPRTKVTRSSRQRLLRSVAVSARSPFRKTWYSGTSVRISRSCPRSGRVGSPG